MPKTIVIQGSLAKQYADQTHESKLIYERAKKFLPGGVSYAIRYFEPYPFYVTKGKGSRIWDVDGNSYTDYWMGHGAIVMGHAFRPVIQAASKQLSLGPHLGFANEWEVAHARQIVKMVPSAEKVRPTNSGTEAGMYCIRLARAFTGRTKIAKFEGHWHGGYDALHKAVTYPYDAPASAGLHPGLMEDTVVLPFNNMDGVRERISGMEKDIACFIVEPVVLGGGAIPPEQGFLQELRELSIKVGALLIFDEVVTGFRLSPGGAQELYGVKPDLTTLGKTVGGSVFPAGAVCGRADIMDRMDHLRFPKPNERSFHGGTYVGNPLTSRAGYTLLTELERRKRTLYPHLDGLGKRMREGLEDTFLHWNYPASVTGIGSIVGVHFVRKKPKDVTSSQANKDQVASRQYHAFMLAKGQAFLTPETPHLLLSAAHTTSEIDDFIQATEDFVRKYKQG